jgi:hypothetical protein
MCTLQGVFTLGGVHSLDVCTFGGVYTLGGVYISSGKKGKTQFYLLPMIVPLKCVYLSQRVYLKRSVYLRSGVDLMRNVYFWSVYILSSNNPFLLRIVCLK